MTLLTRTDEDSLSVGKQSPKNKSLKSSAKEKEKKQSPKPSQSSSTKDKTKSPSKNSNVLKRLPYDMRATITSKLSPKSLVKFTMVNKELLAQKDELSTTHQKRAIRAAIVAKKAITALDKFILSFPKNRQELTMVRHEAENDYDFEDDEQGYGKPMPIEKYFKNKVLQSKTKRPTDYLLSFIKKQFKLHLPRLGKKTVVFGIPTTPDENEFDDDQPKFNFGQSTHGTYRGMGFINFNKLYDFNMYKLHMSNEKAPFGTFHVNFFEPSTENDILIAMGIIMVYKQLSSTMKKPDLKSCIFILPIATMRPTGDDIFFLKFINYFEALSTVGIDNVIFACPNKTVAQKINNVLENTTMTVKLSAV